jgi:hypothetical protein
MDNMEDVAMRTRILLGVILVLSLLPVRAWSWGPGMSGGFHGGFHGGGFHGGRGPHGFPGWPRGGGLPPGQHFGAPFFGGWNQGFLFRDQQFFFGSSGGFPPLGAPGSPTGRFLRQAPVFHLPFFCMSDRLEFENKAQFFAHLQQAHGIPPEQAWSACSVVSRTQIGFFGR